MPKSPLKSSNIWEVPATEIQEFSDKKNKYCMCVFTINEGQRIKKQLKKMATYKNLLDIIIADGGSSDNSLKTTLLKKCGVRILLTKKDKSAGLSSQMRMAFAYALNQNYKGIITIDGNNKDNPKAIPQFIDLLDKQYDYVQGSRYIKGGKEINTPLDRHLAVRLIHAPIISLFSGFKFTDTTNGFRAYSDRLLNDKKIKVFRNVFNDYELHYYLAIKAVRCGYKVTELPVERKYPRHSTPTKIKKVVGEIKILLTLVRVICGYYEPR